MEKYFIWLLMCISCAGKAPEPAHESRSYIPENDLPIARHQVNFDSLIMNYIQKSGREFSVNLSSEEVAWLLDDTLQTDSASYRIYRVGRTVVDSGGINPRFATDAWIYIDQFTGAFYKYDLPNERLVRWP